MAIIPVTRQRGVVYGRSPRTVLACILPAYMLIIILRMIEIPRPVSGAQPAVQHSIQRGYAAVMQVGRRDPDTVQRRRDIAVKGLQPRRMIPLCKPALIEPRDELRALIIAFIQKRVGPYGGFRDQQVGILAAMTFGAVLYKK